MEFYKKVSMYTNYGLYKSYFISLPDGIAELAKLIRFQTIHRVELRRAFLSEEDNLIKKEYPWYQYRLHDDILLTAPAMTAELFRMDTRGFTYAREIKHKAILTCRYVSVLTASILKAKGYACRVRSGFGNYFKSKDAAIDHWIVQYWNEEEQRWVNLDADNANTLQDFDVFDMDTKGRYFFAAQAWLDVRSGKRNVDYFVHGNFRTGLPMLAQAVFFDFHALMNDEISYLFFPTYLSEDRKFYELSADDLKEIDDLANLLLDPDAHFDELRYLFQNNKKLRVLNTPLLSDRDHVEL